MPMLPPSKLTLKLLPSLEKVFPDKVPQSCLTSNRFTVLRGDCISFQVGLFISGFMASPIKVEVVSPLAEHITVRSVNNVVANLSALPLFDEDYLMTGPGIVPDLLLPLSDGYATFAARQWNALWVELNIPPGYPKGEYEIEFRFDSEAGIFGFGDELHEKLAVQVEVLPAELPPQKLLCTHWLYTDCIANYYGVEAFSEEHWDYIEKHVQSAVRMGNNMLFTPVFTPPLNTLPGRERLTTQLVDVTEKDGTYTFGFDKLRRWVEMALRCGITHFEISHLFSQWGAVYPTKIIINGEKRFGWDVKADTGEYQEFLSQFLPALVAELRELGVAENTVFHVSDEPAETMLESYGKAVAMVEPHVKGFPIMDALSDYDFYEKGIVKKPVPSSDHITPFIENNVPGLWTYYCVGQFKDVANRFMSMPSSRSRIIAPQLYKYDIEGFLHWGFDFYNDSRSIGLVNPFVSTDAGQGFPSGDPFMVYPGAKGETLESIRYMVFREAMYDMRAFSLLESLIGKEAVVALIEEEAGGPITFSSYPKSQTYLLRLRERVNRAIVENMKA